MASRRFMQWSVALATITAASAAGAQTRGEEGLDVLEQVFRGLDSNQNGRIERPEATEQLSMLVGALFFRADVDGDGVVSAAEARRATASMPGLSEALGAVAGHLTGEELDALDARIGADWNAPISAAQAHEVTERAVDALFATVDRDDDGTLSPRELHVGWIWLVPHATEEPR